MSTSDEKRVKLRQQLERDVLAADFLISVFWSAMSSFRHDTILRPFPPSFVRGGSTVTDGVSSRDGEHAQKITEEDKDMDGLRTVFESIPPLNKLLEGNNDVDSLQLTSSATDLLLWLTTPKGFTLSCQSPTLLQDLNLHTDKHTSNLHYMFELNYTEKNETKFQSIAKEHGILYAFHGSSVENFHSILHNGLLNLFNKASAFGEGTYVSTDLGVCLNWSPSGALWPKTLLTPTASCVAVCEVVKHPSIMSRQQSGGEPNIQGKVPERYFVVPNDEFLRVKYVLLYGRKQVKSSKPSGPVLRRAFWSWMCRHWFIVVIVTYIVFLLCMGLMSSKPFRRLYRKYLSHLL